MSAISSYINSLSPSGYWKFDETSGTSAADSGPNGLTGTYNGTYTLGSSPLNSNPDGTEYGAYLSGTAFVQVSHHSSLDISSAFTFFGLFRRTSGASGTLFHKGDTSIGANQGAWISSTTSGALDINYFNGGWYTDSLGVTLPGSGLPSSVCFIYNGGTSVTTVIDGVATSATLSVALPSTTQPLSLGVYKAGGSYGGGFTGTVDEIAWFGSALTEAQAIALHSASLLPSITFASSSALSFITAALAEVSYDIGSLSSFSPDTADRALSIASFSDFVAVTDQRDLSISTGSGFAANHGFSFSIPSSSDWGPFIHFPVYSVFELETGTVLDGMAAAQVDTKFLSFVRSAFSPGSGHIQPLRFFSSPRTTVSFSGVATGASSFLSAPASSAAFVPKILHARAFSGYGQSTATFYGIWNIRAEFSSGSQSSTFFAALQAAISAGQVSTGTAAAFYSSFSYQPLQFPPEDADVVFATSRTNEIMVTT